MAPPATIHRIRVDLSDVERGVYEELDFRVARHPSESIRYLLTRTLAYCLSYQDGLTFSKAGLHTAEEPPLAVHDPTGRLLTWIDVGSPSAERLHKASKAAGRVIIYTHSPLLALRAEAGSIHKSSAIEVVTLDASLLDSLEPHVDRQMDLGLTRNEGQLYLTLGEHTFESTLQQDRLRGEPS